MKSLFLFFVPFIFNIAKFTTSAAIATPNFYGDINREVDCAYFNNNPDTVYARAKAVAGSKRHAKRAIGPWKIVGEGKNFPVEDCFKLITDPKKVIIFSVDGDFEKLRAFPRGPGMLQLKLARGPNAPTTPAPVPSFIDDASFDGVVFGFSESEYGPEHAYTKEQVGTFLGEYKNVQVSTKRFIQLNSVLVQRSPSGTFSKLFNENPTGIIAYQTNRASGSKIVNSAEIAAKLEAPRFLPVFFDVGNRTDVNRDDEPSSEGTEGPVTEESAGSDEPETQETGETGFPTDETEAPAPDTAAPETTTESTGGATSVVTGQLLEIVAALLSIAFYRIM